MKSSIVVLVNTKSGPDSKSDCVNMLREQFARAGLDPQIHPFDRGEDLMQQARRAVAEGCGVLVAAGGDGTVSGCASVVVGTETKLAVLPMGTLNHFAKDLGIPLTVPEAVQVVAGGTTAVVDVGEVNGRVFVNNSSIGLYPALVHHRERQQRLGKRKWSAFVRAMWTVLGRFPMIRVAVEIDGLPIVHKTPLVFVGNNAYEIHGLRLGTRSRLDQAKLCVYLTRDVSRRRLFVFALRALVGKLRDADDFDMLETEKLSIRMARRRTRVAADGEVTHLDTPLEYRIRAKALKVIVPVKEDAAVDA